jgi:hypothetical protein
MVNPPLSIELPRRSASVTCQVKTRQRGRHNDRTCRLSVPTTDGVPSPGRRLASPPRPAKLDQDRTPGPQPGREAGPQRSRGHPHAGTEQNRPRRRESPASEPPQQAIGDAGGDAATAAVLARACQRPQPHSTVGDERAGRGRRAPTLPRQWRRPPPGRRGEGGGRYTKWRSLSWRMPRATSRSAIAVRRSEMSSPSCTVILQLMGRLARRSSR